MMGLSLVSCAGYIVTTIVPDIPGADMINAVSPFAFAFLGFPTFGFRAESARRLERAIDNYNLSIMGIPVHRR
jgi:hypothetical protein